MHFLSNKPLAPIFIGVFWWFFVKDNGYLLDQVRKYGLQAVYLVYPFETIVIILGWLILAFSFATYFGYRWDPLDSLLSRLVKITGTRSEDIFYQLREQEVARKKQKNENDQIWVQARLKNGYTYRGKLMFAGYRRDGMSRELLLADVKFYPSPIQVGETATIYPKRYDFALIDFANCESLEVLFGTK